MDISLAYYCFHEIHMLPSDFLKLNRDDKIVMTAFIEYRNEYEERKMNENK